MRCSFLIGGIRTKNFLMNSELCISYSKSFGLPNWGNLHFLQKFLLSKFVTKGEKDSDLTGRLKLGASLDSPTWTTVFQTTEPSPIAFLKSLVWTR